VPRFSQFSKRKLDQCHIDLQIIFEELINFYDCTILEGHRSEERQAELFRTGKSMVEFPNSKHNAEPSMAVDVAPYPVNWSNKPKNLARYYQMSGAVLALVEKLLDEKRITHKVRYGGDWNSSQSFDDQSFDDLVHFELVRSPR